LATSSLDLRSWSLAVALSASACVKTALHDDDRCSRHKRHRHCGENTALCWQHIS
jgi:hypothetical protein